MSIEITMPKLGFDMEEGTLIKWLKRIGDSVKKGEPLLEIETDKASVEIEALQDGVLTDVFAEPGQVIPVGTVIGRLNGSDEKYETPASFTETKKQPVPLERNDSTMVVPVSRYSGAGKNQPAPSSPFNISPLARRIAKEKNIDISQLHGTGHGGMIVKEDIVSFESMLALEEPTTTALSNEDQMVPMSRLRQRVAKRMVQSNAEIPQFTVSIAIELDQVLELRKRYNDIHSEEPWSLNDVFIRATALALEKYPRLNSSYQDEGILYHTQFNLGIAVGLDEGLITVVLHDANQKAIAQISSETKTLIQRAREEKLKSTDIEGSTFTISNLGMYGVDDFRAIVNPPETAILAIGVVQIVPRYKDGGFIPRSVAKFVLSVDHRVSDGVEAAQFLNQLKTYLEEPIYLIR